MVSDKQRPCVLAATFACVMLAASCYPACSADPVDMPQQFARMVQLVQFEISGGRLISYPHRVGQRTNQTIEEAGIRYELKIDSRPPASSVTYQVTAPYFELRITADHGERFVIERTSTAAPPEGAKAVSPFSLEQTRGKPLRITMGQGEGRRTIAVSSIWHLMLAEPDAFRNEVIPLLQILRPDWDLVSISDEIENSLIHQAKIDRGNQQEHWSLLVRNLASDMFAVRESADRQLREAGPAVLPLLRRLDPSHIDAEQRFRIRRIVSALSAAESADTVDSVIAWLASDPATWLALMKREDESLRRTAVEQLQLLLGRPIEFDPSADETSRHTQIEQLKKTISGLES